MVKIVDPVSGISATALSESLTRVAANKKFSRRKPIEVRYVAALDNLTNVIAIGVARYLGDIVSPHNIIAQTFQGEVGPTTSTEEGDCSDLLQFDSSWIAS